MVRLASDNDLEAIHHLIEVLEDTTFDKKIFAATFLSNLNNDANHYYVAEYKGKIVGFCGAFEYLALHNCHKVIEIQELIVDEAFRSQNIGLNLISEIEKLAHKLNCQLIELTSNVRRTKAHAFYIRNGYKRGHFRFKKEI